MIGMVENTIPLRNYPKGELNFNDFLSGLTTRTLACFDNQSYGYEDLVCELNIDLDPSRNPLIDVMFSYLKYEKPELEIPGLTLHLCDEGRGITQYDLTLLARETDEKLFLTYEYSSELFKQETVARFVFYFKEIIYAVISNPNKKISQIEIITNEEKDLILHTFNNTKVIYPKNASIAQLFEEQARKTPAAIALVCEGKELTYAELNKKADVLATCLKDNRVSANTLWE